MGALLAQVLPFAVGAAISPTVLAMQLVVVSGKVAPLRRGVAFVVGCAAVLVGEGILALALAGDGGPGGPGTRGGILRLAIAAILLANGIRLIVRPPAPRERSAPSSPSPRLPRFAVLGAILMATNVTTLVLYFPAMHLIGASDAGLPAELATFAILSTIVLLPALAPLLAVSVAGEGARRRLHAMNDFLSRHRREVGIVISFGFAALLAIQGIARLS